jgi:hypothetical protein
MQINVESRPVAASTSRRNDESFRMIVIGGLLANCLLTLGCIVMLGLWEWRLVVFKNGVKEGVKAWNESVTHPR